MLAENQFGCAAKLYRKSGHPRMLFDQGQLDSLQKLVKTDDGKKILGAMQRELRPVIQRARETPDLTKLFLGKDDDSAGFSFSLVSRSFEIGLVGLLTENRLAVDTALRILETIPRLGKGFVDDDSCGIYPLFYLAYDLLHDRLGPQTAAEIREWTLEHVLKGLRGRVERLLYIGPGMNVPLCNCRYAIYPTLAIQGDPGVPDLSDFIEVGCRFMKAFCKTGIGPNGFPEEDIGYGTACISYVIEIGEMLLRSGHMDLFKQPNLRAFGRALLHFVQPWGEALSITGDIGNGWTYDHVPLARIAHETKDPTLIWLLDSTINPSYGEQVKLKNGRRVLGRYSSLLYLDVLKSAPVHPADADLPTAFEASQRGIVSVRSSWDRNATFAFMDGSQRRASVAGHWHSSAGHFSLTALGEYFSVDTGRYNCDYDQHSVMLVDGESPHSTEGEWGGVNRMGRLLDFTPGPVCDTATVDSSQMNDCFWSFRTMGLVKGDEITPYLWTVDDVNKANDFREFWWTLQTHPRNQIKARGEEATIIGARHGNMLDIGFAYPSPEEYPTPHSLKITQDVITTSSYKYVKGDLDELTEERAPLTWSVLKRPRLIAKLSGYNGKLMSVMVPRRKGRKPTNIQRLESCPNSLAVKIVFPRVTDTLIYAYEHGFLESEDIVAEGDFLIVRRRRRDNKVVASAMRNGTSLTVAGKRIHQK